MITPLKVTSEYSLLKSLIRIPDLINFLKDHNITSCALVDDELFGVMEFYLSCKENNIKPIIGLDLIIDDKHLYIYAKNYEGYQKLLKINTLKFNKIDYADIEDKNIIIVIPYNNLDCYQEFKNKKNVYIAYSKLSEKKNALLISENVVYLKNIRCLKENDILYLPYLKDLGGKFVYDENEYFKDEKKDSDDVQRIDDFVNIFALEIPFDKRYIPVFNEKIDSYRYLCKLASEGLKKRCDGNVPKEYLERLNMELNTIKEMGFVDYFLIVYDYVLYAKKHHCLVGPGRGSASGSLVSYSIGITDIDPIKYDLLFARFLNPSRKKMPDIDIDFEDTKRDEIIDYVKNKYGKKQVALGITFIQMKSKLVLRDVARILNIDKILLEKFLRNINASLTLTENKENNTVKKYLEIYPDLNKLYDIAIHLENLKKSISTHAAGVVICSEQLDNIIPIYIENDNIKTGFPMDYLEKLGLLKMDFLGLHNLNLISQIINKIPNLKLSDIPLDDEKTFALFQKGDTDDIFQFESNYAKNNLIKLNVKSFDELSIAVALVRPGPSNQIDAYVENKTDINDSLKDILGSTRGIIIFQEQVMKLFEVIGGYTPFEADNVRIAMSKKKEDIIEKEQERFISSAVSRGYSQDFVVNLFNQVKRFAEYGFNKSHSVAYALIAYQMAYFKANYPVIFNLVLLNNSKSINDKKRLFNNLRQLDIKILKPNINVSTKEYIYKNKYLLMPLNSVKGLNDNVIDEILLRKDKKYVDIFDLFIKCNNILNESVYKILVLSGLLDEFKIGRKTLLENYELIKNYAKMGDSNLAKPLLETKEEYTSEELRSMELEYYGFYIGNHPSGLYKNCVKIKDCAKFLFKNVKMVLLVEKVTKIKTKKGEEMAFALVSDETGESEITLFPEVYKTILDLKTNDLVEVDVKCSKRFDKYQIIVNNIKRK